MPATTCPLPTEPPSPACQQDRLFLSANHQNALTYLEYGIMERMGTILLTGKAGVGKTALVRHLIHALEVGVHLAEISKPLPAAGDFFSLVLQKFGQQPAGRERAQHLEQLFQFLWEANQKGSRPILFLDNVQEQPPQILQEVQVLSNLQADKKPLLQIILVGKPEFHAQLLNEPLSRLAEKIAVSYELMPLSREETIDYVHFCIPGSGDGGPVFTPDALARIHGRSGGNPALINRLCEKVLVYAGLWDKDVIDAATVVQAVAAEKNPPRREPPPRLAGDGARGPAGRRLKPANGDGAGYPGSGRSGSKDSAEYKDFIIKNLHKQLFLERQRYSDLLVKYSRLKQAYEAVKPRR